jgi:ribosome biogenesis GTPase / thiamine phosphate phosphatase
MGREERKLRKHFEERANRERKLARKYSQSTRGQEPDAETAPVSRGLVVGIGPGCCEVLGGDLRLRCRTVLDVAAGDQVLYSPERLKIARVLPRRTVLSRPDPHNPRIERVIAANIDVVVVVVSVKSPPLRPGLIDRYLIAIERSGAAAVVCVNKIDLGDCPALTPYRELGIPILHCSAATGEGVDRLATELAGKTCVFTGHSGVGKSSLLNALEPGLDLSTGEVSEIHNKGRHTTTVAALYTLPNGAVIIDTPGIREFGLWDVTPATLRDYFPEIKDLAAKCTFRDCSHTHEPGCGVKDGVESGRIARARFAAYLRILSALPANPTIY